MRQISVRVIALLCLLNGCAHQSSAESLLLAEGESPTSLRLINGANFHKVMFSPRLAGLDTSREDQIRQQCRAPEKPPQEFAFVPLTFLIGPAIDIVLEGVDKALEAELKKYIGAYSGSVDEKFYASTKSDGPNAAWTCLRFSRAVGPKDQEKVVLDLIAQMELTDEKDALKVRPLRLYFAQAKAKGDQIGITVSLKANSVWRENNRGRSETVFDNTFLSERVDISTRQPVVNYYLDSEWDSRPRLPLIPWSTNDAGNTTGGDVTLIVTVAEVGTPSRLLQHAAKLFTKNKGDLAKMLKESIQKLLPEEQSK